MQDSFANIYSLLHSGVVFITSAASATFYNRPVARG